MGREEVVVVVIVCLFFFSSRRRHTRLVSDWSSDVCSSDLCRQFAWRVVVHCKGWTRAKDGCDYAGRFVRAITDETVNFTFTTCENLPSR